MTDEARPRAELKDFLRARREALSPEAAGLPPRRRRRTPGLRREEVALLADVGVAWYTWLEQGRKISVSKEALGRIGRALRLTPTDLEYLFSLGEAQPPPASSAAVQVDPLVLAVVDGLPSTVGILRVNYATRIGEPQFEALLGALRAGSQQFVRMWDERRTASFDEVDAWTLHISLGRMSVAAVRFFLQSARDCVLSTLPPTDASTAAAFAEFSRRNRKALPRVTSARSARRGK